MSRAGIELNHRKAVLHPPYEGISIKERYAAAPDLLRRSVEITPHPNALLINLAPEKGSVWELKTPTLAAAGENSLRLRPGMASCAGIVTGDQMESIILYVQSPK
jgi:hypothetical protein